MATASRTATRPAAAIDHPAPSARLSRGREAFAALWARDGATFTFLVLAGCQAGTVLVTWELWRDRLFPPPLPVFDAVPGAAPAWAMLVTLAIAVFRRRLGTVLNLCVLAYAVCADQTRLQPEFVSLAILMTAVAFPSLQILGRAHLATMWVWAGMHKLLSTGFATQSAVFISDAVGVSPAYGRWLIVFAELSLGLMALAWRLRRIVVPAAFLVHASILYVLVSNDANSSVWLWNVGIPFAAAFLLTSDRAGHLLSIARRHALLTAAGLTALTVWTFAWLYPAGFYAGVSDAYLSHNLYTSNTRSALVCADPLPPDVRADANATCVDPFAVTLQELNVPFPPETRLYRGWFETTCAPGQYLRIYPIRTRITSGSVRELPCPRPG